MGRRCLALLPALLHCASAPAACAERALLHNEASLLQVRLGVAPAVPAADGVAVGNLAKPLSATGTQASHSTVGGGAPQQRHIYSGTSHRSRALHAWRRNMMDPEGGPTRSLAPGDWMDGDEGVNFFHAASFRQWAALAACCAGSVLVDALVFQRMPPGLRTHLQLILFWLLVAGAFGAWVWWSIGGEAAIEWTSGYLLEWMLSMDNLFVFHIIFRRYKTPPHQVRYGVFVGIVGAIVLRMVFFMTLSTMLHMFTWMRIPFGLLLVWSGIKAAMEEEDEGVPEDLWTVRAMRRCLGDRLSSQYGQKAAIFQRGRDGRMRATLLLVVVVCLEVTDLLFAVDSCTAKVAQIPNQYISFSSSVVAMFGLRAMFFVVEDLVGMFHLLKYGLSVILVFIGLQLVLSPYLHLSASAVCVLILAIFGVSVVGSCLSSPPSGGNSAVEAQGAK